MEAMQTHEWLGKVDRVMTDLLREQPQELVLPLAAQVTASLRNIKAQLSQATSDSKYRLYLPDTVLLSIFSFFENQGDFWACSLVSKEWNKMASYELWKSPIFYSERALERFERIAVNTEKAELVSSLDLTLYNWEFWTNARIGLLLESLPNLTSIRLPKLSSGLECPTIPKDILKNLRFYEYHDTTMDPIAGLRNLVTVLKNAPHLEELVLLRQNYANSFLGKRLIEMVEILPTLKELRTLKFFGPRPGIDILRALILRAPNLKSLAIPRESITEVFVETLFFSCPRIEVLNFAGCALSTDTFDKLSDRLVELDMRGISQRARDADLAIVRLLTGGKSLRKVNISGNEWLAPGLTQLTKAASLANLKELDFSQLDRMGNFAASFWENILINCGNSIQVLKLSKNNTVDDKVGTLIAQYCSRLRYLDCTSTSITDATIVAVVEACGSHIRHLYITDIHNRQQTRRTLQAITEHCKVLEELAISTNGDIRPESSIILEFIRKHGYRLRFLDIPHWPLIDIELSAIARHCFMTIRYLGFQNSPELSNQVFWQLMANCKRLRKLLVLPPPTSVRGGISQGLIAEAIEGIVFK
ncbi:hypothetical protein K7432_013252 [Basidiobolus ranarum]|uniref:F-box domain-containing protein n=1 Tax=Basidiobolus ranarum TaxID=34480 RepID=A0ABR2VS20_9FUNG